MPRLSMNEMTTFRWSFEEDVERYREAGYPAIGVWRQKLADFGEERGIELLRESGLGVSNLMWAGGFTGSDGHTHRESIDDALEAIRLAGAMRAGSLVVYSGSRAGHTVNHARRLLVTALKELAPVAEQHGLRLALEPMHTSCASEWTFLTGLDDALALLDQVGSPAVQLAYDTYHLGWQPGAADRIRSLVDRVAIVHLADGNMPSDSEQTRTRLCEGQVPLAEILAAFHQAGYDGDYDIELIGPDLEHTDYGQLLAHSRAAYEKLVPSASAGAAQG
jgi:sugar phosphate isomerase/epimerase